jgi:transposase
MAQNFIGSSREQGFLLSPDVREWLPADHLAWFVIDAVAQMELAGFYAAYRADGHGRAAYEPSMMVTLLMYAYSTKQRSSRAIEGHCRQDVAYRVITGNLVPDHATVARFVVRHEVTLAELVGEVLRLSDRAGLVKPGWWRLMAHGWRGTRVRTRTASLCRSRGRCWLRPRRPTKPRVSCMARLAA